MRKESKNMKSMLHKFRLCFTIPLFISLVRDGGERVMEIKETKLIFNNSLKPIDFST